MSKLKVINSIVAVLFVVFILAGCAGMTPTEQRTLSGAAIGAGAGALGGYLYDQSLRR
jgi:hypothetical protein